MSFWNDSTIKTNLNWSGRNFPFLLTAFHSLTPHSFKFLWILSKNLRHQAQFLSEYNSQVGSRRGSVEECERESAFIELTTIASFERRSEGFASNKYLAQFCGNAPFKMEFQSSTHNRNSSSSNSKLHRVEVTKMWRSVSLKNLNRLCQIQSRTIIMMMTMTMMRIIRLGGAGGESENSFLAWIYRFSILS